MLEQAGRLPLDPRRLAVAVRTTAGLVLHTGDYKMDQLPLDGRLIDLRAFGMVEDLVTAS